MSTSLLELADDLHHHPGLVVRIDGHAVPIDPAAAPDPLALLGIRFGPTVDAVAVPFVADRSLVLAVERTGEAILVGPRGGPAPPLHAPSLTLDLARRSLGLATAPAERPAAELVDTVWLDRLLTLVLDAPLGDPPRWPALCRRHPLVTSDAPASPEGLRHRTERSGDWSTLRRRVVDGVADWPPVSPGLAAWFDDGAFARSAFAALVDADAALADLHELLRPADANRVSDALSRR